MLKHLPISAIKKVVFDPRHCQVEQFGKSKRGRRIRLSLNQEIYHGLDPISLTLEIGDRVRLIDTIGLSDLKKKAVRKILNNHNRHHQS